MTRLPRQYYLVADGGCIASDDLCGLLEISRSVRGRLDVRAASGVLLAWRNAAGASTYDRGAS